MPDVDVFRQFARVTSEIKDLEAQIEVLKEERDKYEREGIDLLTEQGIDKLTVDGRTFSIREDFYPKPIEGLKEQAMKALKRAGLKMFVTESANSRTLGSYIKDLKARGEEVPKVFSRFFEMKPVYRLGQRKA